MVAIGAATVTLMGLIATGATEASATSSLTAPQDRVAVIIVGGSAAAHVEIGRLGGVVSGSLPIVDGLTAVVPTAALPLLRSVPGVRSVTADGTLRPLDVRWGDDSTGEAAEASLSTGHWQADHDGGSAFTVAKDIGAQTVWGKSDPNDGDRKLTGHGVGVALIDTGVAPVEGLRTPGKVVNGPDLSFDSQAPNLRTLDGYGHGTHMAGLIAGRDSNVPVGGEADSKHFVGMAPDARIVNVKVGAADGAVDVSQMIAGIDWVVTNRAAHNIRVLNLSYGTESTQAVTLDPLAHAVQNAWRAGIVVVVAAGNNGDAGPRPLTMPAADPFVIAVGSSDHRGSDKPEDHRVGAWTNSGNDTRRPDLLAPGKSAVSLRTPGSVADVQHPEGLVVGDSTGRLFRGTGTSQSAAVVSGAVALLLQRSPSLTPDQVKGLLKANADKLSADSSRTQGAGQLDIKGAVEQLEGGTAPRYTQSFLRSAGTGSLETARGGSFVADPITGVDLRGEQDIFGAGWDAATWAKASTARSAWNGGVWRDATWAGATTTGTSTPAVTWTRGSWSGADWTRGSWSSNTFLRGSWSGNDWSRGSWSGEDWSRGSWSRASWSRGSWSRASWSRASWSGQAAQ